MCGRESEVELSLELSKALAKIRLDLVYSS